MNTLICSVVTGTAPELTATKATRGPTCTMADDTVDRSAMPAGGGPTHEL